MFKHYLVTALRNFRRHWVTTSVNVISLTLGLICFIGALSVVHYFKLDDNHQPGSDRVYFVTQKYGQGNANGLPLEFPTAPFAVGDQLRADLPQLDLVARRAGNGLKAFSVDGTAHDVSGSYADAEFLKLFPLLFKEGDPATALTRPHSAVLSERAAKRLFGASSALGRTILLEGQQPIIVDGVVAVPARPSHIVDRESDIGFSFDVLLSMDTLEAAIEHDGGTTAVTKQLRTWSGGMSAVIYARLPADGTVNVELLQKRLSALAKQQSNSTSPRVLDVRPITQFRQMSLDDLAESRTTGLRWSTLLMLVAFTVLLVAALNYANLSTALAATQRKEQSVRRVLGASFKQLAAQHIIEGLLAVGAALVVAFVLIALIDPIARASLQINFLYAWTHSAWLWPQLLAALCCVAFLISVAPIVVTARLGLATSLQHSRGGAPSTVGIRWLVGAQFFLTGALLCFALVVHLQQRELLRYAHDTVPHPIIAIRNDLKRSGIDLEVLRTELLRQPHVESVSAAGFTPWGRAYGLSPVAASRDAGATDVTMMIHNVDHRYFNDLGFGVLAGRVFDPNRANSMDGTQPPSIILDRTAARQLGYDNPTDAVGKLIYPDAAIRAARPDVSLRVIGVVDDKMMQFTTSGASGNAYLYDAKARVPLIRLRAGSVAEGIAEVRNVWRSLAPNFVLRASSIDESIQSYADEKAPYVRTLNAVTALALLVALSGLIGMSIHMANRRRHEIGVRKTLGARTAQLVALLLRDFSRPVVIGGIAAWPLAYFVSRTYLDVYTHRITLSPTPFIASTASVLAVACVAVSWHTARAARMKPADVLRHE